MSTVKKKVLSYALSFVMAFTVFGVFGVSAVNADVEEGGYFVTMSYTDDNGATFTDPKTIKEYTKAEFEALADIGSEEAPAIYMWAKDATTLNPYKVTKGVSYDAILNDLGYGDAAGLVGVYDWAELKGTPGLSRYNKNGFELINYIKKAIIGKSFYDVVYNGEALQYGEGTEVSPVIALEYKELASKKSLKDFPNATIAEIPDDAWAVGGNSSTETKFDARSFVGMETPEETGGFRSCSGTRNGLDLVKAYDTTIEVNGETVYFEKDAESVELPAVFADKDITGWSYIKKVDGKDTVVDLGLTPSGADLVAAGDATLFPTPKTIDDVVIVPSVGLDKAVVAKKSVTLKYFVDGDAAGVEIAYQVKGKSAWKTVNATSLTSKKITKLQKGKKYNLKARAYYYTPKQAKAYGEWSGIITTKKVK